MADYTTLNDPLAAFGLGTAAVGINAAGQIVGWYRDASNVAHGYLYSGGSYTTLNALATDINATGQMVGYGFLYSGGSYTSLNDPLASPIPGFGTEALSINDVGQVVGSYEDSNAITHGFLYSGGSYITIDDPLSDPAYPAQVADGINNAGQIVGWYRDASDVAHGYLYSGGSYTTLDDPLGVNGTAAYRINNTGQIVGSYIDASNHSHGFLYSGGNYTTLDDPLGVNGTDALGINDAGQIVGDYYDSSGEHGFIATLTNALTVTPSNTSVNVPAATAFTLPTSRCSVSTPHQASSWPAMATAARSSAIHQCWPRRPS